MAKQDQRRLNAVSKMKNREGVLFVFGRIGSGKGSTIVTLTATHSRSEQASKYRRWSNMVGARWVDVERDRFLAR